MEKKEAQLNEVLSASNLDPASLSVVTRKLEVHFYFSYYNNQMRRFSFLLGSTGCQKYIGKDLFLTCLSLGECLIPDFSSGGQISSIIGMYETWEIRAQCMLSHKSR